MKATIYHNPRCSKSNHAMKRLAEAGAEITVVEYLDDELSKADLRAMIADAGLTVREAIRTGEQQYAALDLEDADDEALLDAIVAHPQILQRPLVRTDRGTAMGRSDDALDSVL